MLFLKKARARSLKCPHNLHSARRFMEIFFCFPQIYGILNTSCNIYNCQPAWLRERQTGRRCVAQTAQHVLQDLALCMYKRPFQQIVRDHQLLLKSGPVNIPILQFRKSPPSYTHLFSRSGIPTRPHYMAFSPTTITNVIKKCIIGTCRYSNVLWYPMEAGAHAGGKNYSKQQHFSSETLIHTFQGRVQSTWLIIFLKLSPIKFRSHIPLHKYQGKHSRLTGMINSNMQDLCNAIHLKVFYKLK